MQTDQSLEETSQAQRLDRMTSSFEAINARIVRLAIALDISLQNDDEVAQAMCRHQPTSDLLMANKREELRGLLVLRYGIQTRYVDEVGIVATRQILIEAEEHLVRKGFKPGDDGVNLERLFNEF
jgi:hypothetical protein